jgi:mono/diheme cytochrome c family protein
VATAARPMPFERKLAHMALDAKLQKEMPRSVSIEANQPNYIAGAHEYFINCAVCHGVPGKEKGAIANGEFPKPPSWGRRPSSGKPRKDRELSEHLIGFGKLRDEFIIGSRRR